MTSPCRHRKRARVWREAVIFVVLFRHRAVCFLISMYLCDFVESSRMSNNFEREATTTPSYRKLLIIVLLDIFYI